MDQKSFDIIIVGAGATGLMAALEMGIAGKKVGVIEARDRIGGRIHTINNPDFGLPVELGAEFIHGKLEPTQNILKKAGGSYYNVTGDIWHSENGRLKPQKDFIEDDNLLNRQFRKLEHDISVDEFIENYLQGDKFESLRYSLRNYVEGYYAADTLRASTFALRDDLNKSGEEQFRVAGGYATLTDYLFKKSMEKDVTFFLSQPVLEVHWKTNQVSIITNRKTFSAQKVLITVPMGVLQTEKIKFVPALPAKMAAARHLGYGPVIKIILQFHEPFWKNKDLTQGMDLRKLSFIFSSAKLPTWWTYHPKEVAMITGWAGGPHADELKEMNESSLVHKALESLGAVFDIDVAFVTKNLKGWEMVNWQLDPFSCGAYSYDVVNGGDAKNIITRPEVDTIFFAGEGLVFGTEIGTVNAALVSGRETAHAMIASFKK